MDWHIPAAHTKPWNGTSSARQPCTRESSSSPTTCPCKNIEESTGWPVVIPLAVRRRVALVSKIGLPTFITNLNSLQREEPGRVQVQNGSGNIVSSYSERRGNDLRAVGANRPEYLAHLSCQEELTYAGSSRVRCRGWWGAGLTGQRRGTAYGRLLRRHRIDASVGADAEIRIATPASPALPGALWLWSRCCCLW